MRPLLLVTASLGFAVVGFLAAFRSYDLRVAAIVGPSMFTLGAAAGRWFDLERHHRRLCVLSKNAAFAITARSGGAAGEGGIIRR